MISKIVGQLKSLDYDSDFFISEPYLIPYFNDKKLKIGFVDAMHEPYLTEADKVLENFLKLNNEGRIKDSQLVFNYYKETLHLGYTKSLDIEVTEQVWDFVHPSEIIIDWDENGDFYLCISCECEWEDEHGLYLVFKDGLKLTRANGHDGGFTD
ncbi:DUF6985 domain-containing protein [Flavobacterium sp. UBA7680]|uniref:DUF6985 domain-containing protein n=1 Tax=Flavobacterium sp. UBA7680 TaxID=1946559 RepID=UPI0025BADC99|nr:hypothetical protein [Flavobacterium sp. UBA7680]